jgi:hypothetical protein
MGGKHHCKAEETGHMFADSFEDGLVRLRKYADRQIAKGYSIVGKRSHLKREVKPGRSDCWRC